MTDTEIEKLAEKEFPYKLQHKDLEYPHDAVTHYQRNAFIAGYKACDAVEQWISVEDIDRLPEFAEYVLVNIGEDTVLKGRRMANGWTAFYSDGEKLADSIRPVTHWQPLPAPPKK